jgi:hypothetical protein
VEATNSVTAVRIQPLEDIISAVVSKLTVVLFQLPVCAHPSPSTAPFVLFVLETGSCFVDQATLKLTV